MNTSNSKLLIKTFDGSLMDIKIKPKCKDSTVTFNVKYYDHEGDGSLMKIKILFRQVVAIYFEVNLFDNYIGSELCGFYEIFNVDQKKEMIEKIFQMRLEGFLYHGDYDYDAKDESDMLNDRKPVDALLEEIERYHLYQQQTQGGVYYILSGGYDVIR